MEFDRTYPEGTIYCPQCEWKGYEIEMNFVPQKKVYDVPNIIFKGPGFHCNDYGNGRAEVK
uniref:Uncharacterized protein n=1 Tax=viral metagenome TaxID=1070528 RepID=A0A6M3IMS5_9ZZZZ